MQTIEGSVYTQVSHIIEGIDSTKNNSPLNGCNIAPVHFILKVEDKKFKNIYFLYIKSEW